MPDTRRGFAFNKTRQSFAATELRVADTHWSRLRGLMMTNGKDFPAGYGLWIVPCRGVHTWAMRFAIDVIYLDSDLKVVHIEENLKPWRFAPVRLEAETVLEVPAHTIWQSGTELGDQFELTVSETGKKVAAA